jgi:hypothetical protein
MAVSTPAAATFVGLHPASAAVIVAMFSFPVSW